MFLALSASFFVTSNSLSASTVIDVKAIGWSRYASKDSSSNGLSWYPTFSTFRLVNSSVFTMRSEPRGRSAMLALSAAGFMATSTFG